MSVHPFDEELFDNKCTIMQVGNFDSKTDIFVLYYQEKVQYGLVHDKITWRQLPWYKIGYPRRDYLIDQICNLFCDKHHPSNMRAYEFNNGRWIDISKDYIHEDAVLPIRARERVFTHEYIQKRKADTPPQDILCMKGKRK